MVSESCQNTGDSLRVAVPMVKGGAGRTTTAVNLASAFHMRKHDVLLVDADPQGSATFNLGLDDLYKRDRPKMRDLLLEDGRFDEVLSIIASRDEFDVIPAHLEDVELKTDLDKKGKSRQRLKMLLDELNGAYDVIIIDVPRDVGMLLTNAIIAAGSVLYAAQPCEISKYALEMMLAQIESLEMNSDQDIQELGIVANQVSPDDASDKMVDWFEYKFSEDTVFEIPNRVAIERAFQQKASIFEYNRQGFPSQNVVELRSRYDNIAAHIETIHE